MTKRLLLWLALLAVGASVPEVRAEALGRCGRCGRGHHEAAAGCADSCHAHHAAPCQAYALVEKTIMVPTMVTETRRVSVTEYRTERRQRNVTVMRQIPETKTMTREYTVMVPETRTRTENYTVMKPVTREVTREYTVNVPVKETRQGTRRVCRTIPVNETRTVMVAETKTRTENYTVMKPVTKQVTREFTVNVAHRETREGVRRVCRWVPSHETRTVREDHGHFEERTVEVAAATPACDDGGHGRARRGLFRRRCCYEPVCCNVCGGHGSDCNACGHHAGAAGACDVVSILQRVWIPKIVDRQETVTVNRAQMVDEKYTYDVTVCRPEKRSETLNVTEYVPEQKSRDVQYTVHVPKQETVTVNRAQMVDEAYTYEVVVCRPELRTKTEMVTEYVREPKSREVQYTVCVPQKKTEQYQVTVYKCVAENRVETYNVQVPVCVERDIQVRVCRMIPKTVVYKVPVHDGCGHCGRAPCCCD